MHAINNNFYKSVSFKKLKYKVLQFSIKKNSNYDF